jgi:hypothetical protein
MVGMGRAVSSWGAAVSASWAEMAAAGSDSALSDVPQALRTSSWAASVSHIHIFFKVKPPVARENKFDFYVL